jgi:uncharacterized protein YndB with AHSA1/START domain
VTSEAHESARILGSLRSENGKGVVRMEDRFDAGIEDVWSALTDPSRLSQWYGEVEGDLRLGGAYRAHVFATGSEINGRVEACEPHLAVLSVGHPAAFGAAGFAQREKSWYMLLFQFEGVAERWLSDNEWENFRSWGHHPDAMATIAELESNGSLTPGLNFYRANITPESWAGSGIELPIVQAPTMGVWSTGDMALTEAQMLDSAAQVAGTWRYERLDDVGHWLQLEAPDAVNALLVDFLPA